VVEVVLLVFIDRRRAGANESHVAPEDVDALREFVDAGSAEEASDRQDPGIVVDFEHQTVHLVLCEQVFFAVFSVHVHGTEFVETEAAAVHADALLMEEDRAGRLDVDDRCEDHIAYSCRDEADESGRDTDHPLDEEFSGGDDAEARRNAGEAVHLFDLRVREFACDAVDVDVYRNAHFEEPVGDLVGPGIIDINKHLIHDVGPCIFQHRVIAGHNGNPQNLSTGYVCINDDDSF